MKRTIGTSRRLAAVLAAAMAVGLLAPLLAMTSAQAVQNTTTSRIAGNDRFATAAAVATTSYPDGASSVVLATGSDFADALSASGLAGAIDAPVLLTLRDSLPSSTIDALETLAPDDVFIIGGTSAISTDVQTTLEGSGYTVERFAGEDRFSTAAAVGDAIAATDDGNPLTDGDGVGSTDNGVTAIVASGTSFPDAVSASQLAFGGRFPILLTTRDAVPPTTLDALDRLGIEHVLVIGGTAAVSDGAEGAIENEGISTARLAGTTRWGTSVAVAEFAGVALEFGGPTVYLATGQAFPDALGGGVISGVNTAPLLLTGTNSVPDELAAYLVDNGSAVDNIVALGGTAAISAATLADAAAAAKLDTNQVFDIDPGGSQIKDESGNAFDDAGRVMYTANGLTAGTEYVIGLVDPNTVFTSGSTTSFTSYTLSDDASTSIETVNGTPNFTAGSGNESQQETGTADADGVITFTVDATEPDSIIPVVFLDEDSDGELGLDGTTPTEPFGIGGRTSWLLAEAPTGDYSNREVTDFNTEDQYFVANANTTTDQSRGSRTFFYTAGDRFRRNGLVISMAQFEGLLSTQDVLTINYIQDDQSRFNVITDSIPDIADLDIALTGDNTVTVSWTASPQADVVYTVYRDDGNGSLTDSNTGNDDPSSYTEVSTLGASTSRTFNETVVSGEPVRYVVLPEGGTSGALDTTADEPDQFGDDVATNYRTAEVVPNIDLRGLLQGTTVDVNTGLSLASAGDVWLLHFTRTVSVASNASLTLDDGTNTVTYMNNTQRSSWSADGTTITITLGTGANSTADINYASTMVTAISGITSGSDTLTLSKLADKTLEHNGPELMADSSTCDAGDTQCTVQFNETVSESSAENRNNYRFLSSSSSLNSISLGADGRTITLSFTGGLGPDNNIAPSINSAPAIGVADTDGQASGQEPFDFVRPTVG